MNASSTEEQEGGEEDGNIGIKQQLETMFGNATAALEKKPMKLHRRGSTQMITGTYPIAG